MQFKKKIAALFALAYLSSPMIVLGQWVSGTGTGGYSNSGGFGLPGAKIYDIIAATLSWLLAVLGFFAVMGFVISGLQYLTAAGDEGQIDTAKTNMKYSIIGVIVALMGYVVVKAVDAWLAGGAAF